MLDKSKRLQGFVIGLKLIFSGPLSFCGVKVREFQFLIRTLYRLQTPQFLREPILFYFATFLVTVRVLF